MSWFRKRPQFDRSRMKSRLKMAITRLNMKKSKSTNAVKIVKREIAKLLQEERDESARIKVESVIRDEFMIEAIEILQMFLELVFARVSLIAESRQCPHDMKEAISTLCWVAPRLDNVPELLEIRDLIAMKFSKKFVSDAMNNKDLAVNKRVMWKMSIKVPEPALCLKYLKAIATEYGVEWDDSAIDGLVEPFGTGGRQGGGLGPPPDLGGMGGMGGGGVQAPPPPYDPGMGGGGGVGGGGMMMPGGVPPGAGGAGGLPFADPTVFSAAAQPAIIPSAMPPAGAGLAPVAGLPPAAPAPTTTFQPPAGGDAPNPSFDFDALQRRFEELKKADD